MLAEMLDIAILTHKDQRHKYQESVVGMAGEVLSSTEGEMTKKLDEARTTESGIGQEQAAATQKVEELSATAQQKSEVVEERRVVVDGHASVFKEKTDALHAAEAADAEIAQQHDEHSKRAEMITKTKEEALATVQEDVVVEEKIKELVESLSPAQLGFEVDESVRVALPDALCKVPNERGEFDVKVVTQLEEELNRAVKTLEEKLGQLAEEKAKRSSALIEIRGVFDEADKKQQESSEQLESVEQEQKAAQDAVKEAQSELKAVVKRMKAATKSATVAQKQLADFQKGPWSAFASLRDRVLESTAQVGAKEGVAKECEIPVEVSGDAAEAVEVCA